MNTIGTRLAKLPLSLNEEREIEVFDGPLIVLLRTISRDPFLRVWVDAEELTNRWLLFRTTDMALTKFLYGKYTLRQLMVGSADGYVFVVDYRHNELAHVSLASVAELPSEIIPDDDSFHDPARSPDVPAPEQPILLDGSWNMAELASLERTYANAYSFLNVFAGTGGIEALRPDHFTNWNFDRGFPVARIFQQVGGRLPKEAIPETQSVQYASPGLLRLRVNREFADVFRGAFQRYVENETKIQLAANPVRELVNEIYQKTKIRGETKPRTSSVVKTDPEIVALNDALAPPVDALIKALGFIDKKILYSTASIHETAARVLLAYLKKLETLARSHAEGTAQIL